MRDKNSIGNDGYITVIYFWTKRLFVKIGLRRTAAYNFSYFCCNTMIILRHDEPTVFSGKDVRKNRKSWHVYDERVKHVYAVFFVTSGP